MKRDVIKLGKIINKEVKGVPWKIVVNLDANLAIIIRDLLLHFKKNVITIPNNFENKKAWLKKLEEVSNMFDLYAKNIYENDSEKRNENLVKEMFAELESIFPLLWEI